MIIKLKFSLTWNYVSYMLTLRCTLTELYTYSLNSDVRSKIVLLIDRTLRFFCHDL